MAAECHCRGCGNKVPNGGLNGLCPICLFREGLAEDGPAVETGPFMSATLDRLDQSLGGLPMVLLRDSEAGDAPGAVVQPGSLEMPPAGDRHGRLQLLGEIARGGMGAVLKGRDPGLGRDLAVKVLLDAHRDNPDLVRRFIEEAQIGGQLQHPGIVPIYELGAFADHRPYFAMKLVKGRTLASLLDERADSEYDLPRFLSIFESVCQTIAYAHSRGVIHRDLKPSNIMVGSFGEVQVMDWGLAKVLPQGGVADDVSAGKTRERDTVIATARSGGDSDSDLSKAGSVLGTPSYMAPEQARGEVDRVDERCDVFALGSILCESLTGEPAFTGRSSGEIQRKASRGELTEAIGRLDSSEGDDELIALAKDCLAAELDDRPRHAGEVASRINAYQIGVQERLRQAEIERAEEKARAEEASKRASVERQRSRLTLALAASVFGLITLGGGGWLYLGQLRAQRRASTERVVTKALDDANLLRGQARAAATGDLSRWPEALAAANKARALLAAGEPEPALGDRLDSLVADLERDQAAASARAAELIKDRRFLERLDTIRVSRAAQQERPNYSGAAVPTDDAYAAAFREFGIDPLKLESVEAGHRLLSRSDPVALAFFLDDWNVTRRRANRSAKRLVAAAHVLDPDPWRDRLREQISFGGDHEMQALVLAVLADESAVSRMPFQSLMLMARMFMTGEEYLNAEKVLKRAWRVRQDDFWVCYDLGEISQNPTDRIRFSTAAVTLRPKDANAHACLAEALLPSPSTYPVGSGPGFSCLNESPIGPFWGTGENPAADLDDGINEFRAAVRLAPQFARLHSRLALSLLRKGGSVAEAMTSCREAFRLEPENGEYHYQAACGLCLSGETALAIVEAQEAIRLGPSSDLFLFLAWMFEREGSHELAFDAYRRGLISPVVAAQVISGYMHRVEKPEVEFAVYREAILLEPGRAEIHQLFANDLLEHDRVDEAIAEYREAVRLNPDNPKLHCLLGDALVEASNLDEAAKEYAKEIAIYREWVSESPKNGWFRYSLIEALFRGERFEEAKDEYRNAIRNCPKMAPAAHSGLGGILNGQGYLTQAIVEYRDAVRLFRGSNDSSKDLVLSLIELGEIDAAVAEVQESMRWLPEDPNHLVLLGRANVSRGELKQALTNFREAHRVSQQPSGELKAHLQDAERMAALDARFDAIRSGRELLAEASKSLEFADMCRLTKRFAVSTRFYRDAFQAKPAMVDDLSQRHRLHAAIAAAQAGTNPKPDKDAAALDDAERARWRAQALAWLRAERDACAKIIEPTVAVQPKPNPPAPTDVPKLALARKTLDILIHHRDLACIRDQANLKKLTADEQRNWQALWADVSALLKKAGAL
jgi:serine/threonine protein kinase/Tfp pilus assembly protein PilF